MTAAGLLIGGVLMFSKVFLFLMTVFLYSVMADASYYRVVFSAEKEIDADKRTHILVTSRGNDLGLLPHLSAVSKASKIVERFPDEQVILFLPIDGFLGPVELKKMGVVNFQLKSELLNPKTLINELVQFNKIASFNSFGHGAIIEGIFLDAIGDKDVRWYPYDKDTKRLAGHFTDDAYAILNACNNGHHLASYLSKMWGIPIAGALTGTHFETLHKDGNFYFVDPASSKNVSVDSQNMLENPKKCFGACYRMKPDNHVYNGHYGKYAKGLNFYKFFCPNISEDKCLTAMATSLNVQVSNKNLAKPELNLAEYAALAREWLCPTGTYGSTAQAACIQKLEEISVHIAFEEQLGSLMSYTPYRGNSLQCNFQSCYQPVACHKTYWTIDQCAKQGVQSEASDTFVREYINYLRGFELTQK